MPPDGRKFNEAELRDNDHSGRPLFEGKVDITQKITNVRCWPKADIG
jgi:hypothetical protein